MKILLVCAGGMSTGLIVGSMKREAEKLAVNSEIEAIALSHLPQVIEGASCVLVAPQVRHRLKGIEEMGQKSGKPVALIDPIAYGRLDGKMILEQAMAMVK